jgi:hypothetical protein
MNIEIGTKLSDISLEHVCSVQEVHVYRGSTGTDVRIRLVTLNNCDPSHAGLFVNGVCVATLQLCEGITLVTGY